MPREIEKCEKSVYKYGTTVLIFAVNECEIDLSQICPCTVVEQKMQRLLASIGIYGYSRPVTRNFSPLK